MRSRLTPGLGAALALLLAGCGPDAGSPVDPSLKYGRPGGEETTFGNNLSVPVIFAEGVGVTGFAIDKSDVTTTGLRPTAAQLLTLGVDAPVFEELPWSELGTPEPSGYYCQGTASTWQAQWDVGEPGTPVPVVSKWGDNLTNQAWNVNSVIRVEVNLYPAWPVEMSGFAMPFAYGTNANEVKCTDGTEVVAPPTLFSHTARLRIEKLDENREPTGWTYFDKSIADKFAAAGDGPEWYAAEVNVSGLVIYGYNWQLRGASVPAGQSKDGWWRLTFYLDKEYTTQFGGGGTYYGNAQIIPPADVGTKFTPVIGTLPNGTTYTQLDIRISTNKSKKPETPGGGGE